MKPGLGTLEPRRSSLGDGRGLWRSQRAALKRHLGIPSPGLGSCQGREGSDDEFFEPDWERLMAREVLGVEPIEIPGGHFPMVENPDCLASVLDRLARQHGKRRR